MVVCGLPYFKLCDSVILFIPAYQSHDVKKFWQNFHQPFSMFFFLLQSFHHKIFISIDAQASYPSDFHKYSTVWVVSAYNFDEF